MVKIDPLILIFPIPTGYRLLAGDPAGCFFAAPPRNFT